MVTITNIHRILGKEVMVKGSHFGITNVANNETHYIIKVSSDYYGTITLTLERKATIEMQGYTLYNEYRDMKHYLTIDTLRNKDGFVEAIQRYLNS